MGDAVALLFATDQPERVGAARDPLARSGEERKQGVADASAGAV